MMITISAAAAANITDNNIPTAVYRSLKSLAAAAYNKAVGNVKAIDCIHNSKANDSIFMPKPLFASK